MPNFSEIEETSCGQTHVRTYRQTDGHVRLTLLGQFRRVDLIELNNNTKTFQVFYPCEKHINKYQIQLIKAGFSTAY